MSVSNLQLSRLAVPEPSQGDDLARHVFGVFGVPIDAVDLGGTLSQIANAIEQKQPFFISTPNVNFLVASWKDGGFREALLVSDLCPPDGMPIVWIARLLKLPIRARVAGSDIFEAMKMGARNVQRPRAFLFGGGDNVAKCVSEKLNAKSDGMRCVGAINPGFVSVDEMSHDQIIAAINFSRADFLAVFLSATKAQAWLLRNYDRLTVPVRAQFGATINFEAGTVKRAPAWLRKLGLEWLWRIKEEPYLWRRYWKDGTELLGLISSCVLPLAAGALVRSLRSTESQLEVQIRLSENKDRMIVSLKGDATAEFIEQGIRGFREALDSNKSIEVDLAGTKYLDQRYLGLFLMVRKQLLRRDLALTFPDVPVRIRRWFKLNRFGYLLASH
jgi:N-acetylglucosaminyldiphosphoundecaprenol N-acetyl-beta-D-mannosaminyltransferase